MIITIRGPSGAGKSHLTREVMRDFPVVAPNFTPGRRKPLLYLLRRESGPELALLGHYEIANGGIDTLNSLRETYAMVRELDDAGRDVLYEGKCLSDGAARAMQLVREGRDLRMLYLSTPVDVCVRSVRARGHAIAEKSILHVALRCSREYETLGRAHAHVTQASRERGLALVRAWLAEERESRRAA